MDVADGTQHRQIVLAVRVGVTRGGVEPVARHVVGDGARLAIAGQRAATQLAGVGAVAHLEVGGQKVGRLDVQSLGLGLLTGTLGSLGLGYAMASWTDAAAPWWDAALTAFSLVAQFWMAHKRVECWLLWIVVDVLFVVLFFSKGLYLTAALYGLFTLLAVQGWRTWRRELEPATA